MVCGSNTFNVLILFINSINHFQLPNLLLLVDLMDLLQHKLEYEARELFNGSITGIRLLTLGNVTTDRFELNLSCGHDCGHYSLCPVRHSHAWTRVVVEYLCRKNII